ncbi:MAG: lysylphosphatidylglycerol synthase transmembrane domain-containing protein [Candidatus Binatia bacterium]
MNRSTLMFLLKVLVSLGLLSFLLSQIDLSKLLQVMTSAHLSYLALILVSYILSQFVSCLRWVLLARPLGFRLPFKEFLSFYFIGMFFNLFAPSTVGGDVGRVFYLARGGNQTQEVPWTGRTGSALISVLADRAIGLAVLVWIGAVALTLFSNYPLPVIVRYLTFALAIGFFLGWMLLPFFNRLLEWVKYPLIKNLATGLEVYWRNQQVILQTIILSLIVHFVQAWAQILLGRSLDLEIPWSYCFILYPLVGVFSALPISLNGIGLREFGYKYLLEQIDVSSEKAIAFGLLWFILVALDSLIGGVVFILRKSPKPSAIG